MGINFRVKYPIDTWVLSVFKFSTSVLFCIISGTWIRGKNSFNTSVKFFVQILTARYVSTIEVDIWHFIYIKEKEVGWLSHPLGWSGVAEPPHGWWFSHPMADTKKKKGFWPLGVAEPLPWAKIWGFAHGGGRTTFVAHRGASATPKGQNTFFFLS
jgi:hypothetical protein